LGDLLLHALELGLRLVALGAHLGQPRLLRVHVVRQLQAPVVEANALRLELGLALHPDLVQVRLRLAALAGVDPLLEPPQAGEPLSEQRGTLAPATDLDLVGAIAEAPLLRRVAIANPGRIPANFPAAHRRPSLGRNGIKYPIT